MRNLLKKALLQGPLTGPEREQLMGFLRILQNDSAAPKSERNAAIELLAIMEKRSQ